MSSPFYAAIQSTIQLIIKYTMQKPFQRMIKMTSTVLMCSLVVLEISRLSGMNQGYDLMAYVPWLFYLGRFALVIHLCEAIVVGIYIMVKQDEVRRSPWKQGIYTFFVGTIALLELWQKPQDSEAQK